MDYEDLTDVEFMGTLIMVALFSAGAALLLALAATTF